MIEAMIFDWGGTLTPDGVLHRLADLPELIADR